MTFLNRIKCFPLVNQFHLRRLSYLHRNVDKNYCNNKCLPKAKKEQNRYTGHTFRLSTYHAYTVLSVPTSVPLPYSENMVHQFLHADVCSSNIHVPHPADFPVH
jgi:hypothetical protein